MKRQGYLIEPIAAMDNLELAYYKARKGKADKASVYAFSKDLRANLHLLQSQILSGEVEVGDYHYFTVYDPKKRQICAAPFAQRVLHHALMNVCHPFFEKAQTGDSYASRIGMGTYVALDQAKENTRRCQWFLKLDARKYFDSIHHGVLRQQLCRMFKDDQLLCIFDQIIDSYCVESGRGMPIGNLTSQYFANHYLSAADHYAKEILRIPAYVRYMDDMVLWHNNKEALLEAGRRFKDFVETQLKLELKPFCRNKNTAGLPFLGYLLYPDRTRLAQRSRKRFIEKIKEYGRLLQKGEWSQKEYQRHIEPLTAFTLHADTKVFRQKLLLITEHL
ncbi:MAG TPA: reverse transcriptase domain-containing protein [Saprospiraceae bacterium]|nr:reverse transcriptase domain-containing protein [Saprospiraceae bacterium]HMP25599.1 reverse transcriptase domain-containing protein [Saprospiraceae bacterium]